MTICLKTSSAGSASEGFSDIHAETARMSGITNRVLRPVPDAEARKPIRGRHNLRYAIEKPWVETRGFSIAGGWVGGWVRCWGIGGFLLPWQDKSYVPLSGPHPCLYMHGEPSQWHIRQNVQELKDHCNTIHQGKDPGHPIGAGIDYYCRLHYTVYG